MPSIKRMVKSVIAVAMATILVGTGVAYADEPYIGYNYDWWNDPVPSQNGYVVDRVVYGKDIQDENGVSCGALTEPNDMFFSPKEELYIVDTSFAGSIEPSLQKGRLVVTDKDFKLLTTIEYLDFSEMGKWLEEKEADRDNGLITAALFNKETNKYFNGPTGVFVDEDDIVYVADGDNDRVVSFVVETDSQGRGYGRVVKVYTRPDGTYYDANSTFNPAKVLVDAAKNVYVLIKTITTGAVVFSKEGEFSGYYGANRVETTGEVIVNAFWKLILSRDQVKRMKREVPVEIANFDIDDDNFVYTVTASKNAKTDVLKKMNSAGTNIFVNLGYSDYDFGDVATIYYSKTNTTYSAAITDVDIGENGTINLLDRATGRVFQYDDECTLLFIFGGKGEASSTNGGKQKGTFRNVEAIESLGTNIYVLDRGKNSITVFKQTEFGAIVHKAIALFNSGKYDEAREPWEEALRRDSNYWMAYIGLGNAYLNQGDYETAMDYFYYNSRIGYSDAFKNWRMDFIRDNFTLFAVIIVGLLVLIYIISSVREKSRAKKRAEADRILREQQKKEE